MHLLLVVSS